MNVKIIFANVYKAFRHSLSSPCTPYVYHLSRFSLIKSMYPHCFHLPDKDGRLTYYERPGMFDINQLKKAGITKQDLVEHYVYCMEYLWRVR